MLCPWCGCDERRCGAVRRASTISGRPTWFSIVAGHRRSRQDPAVRRDQRDARLDVAKERDHARLEPALVGAQIAHVLFDQDGLDAQVLFDLSQLVALDPANTTKPSTVMEASARMP